MASVWYYDPVGGNGANGGTSPVDAFALLSEAVAAANLDGGADQVIYAMGNASGTPAVETADIDITCGFLSIIARDSSGTSAVSFLAFRWPETPRVNFNHGGNGFRHTHSSTVTIRGIAFDALDSCVNGWFTDTPGQVLECYDCDWLRTTAEPVKTQADSTFTRCRFGESVNGPHCTGDTTFVACVFDHTEQSALTRNAGTDFISLTSCLFYQCCSVSTGDDYPIDFGGAGVFWSAVRCLFVDNYCKYGAEASSSPVRRCNSYSSDGNVTFHTASNWDGAPGSTDFELIPLFVDAAADDWHLSALSPLLGILSLRAGDPDYTHDRRAMPEVIGPFGETPSLVLTLAATGGTTGSEAFPVSGTANAQLDTVAVTFNGVTTPLDISVDRLSFIANEPFILTEGRNEFEVAGLALNGDASTVWFAVRYEVAQVPLRTNRLLHMFPEGMRSR